LNWSERGRGGFFKVGAGDRGVDGLAFEEPLAETESALDAETAVSVGELETVTVVAEVGEAEGEVVAGSRVDDAGARGDGAGFRGARVGPSVAALGNVREEVGRNVFYKLFTHIGLRIPLDMGF